MTQRLVSVGDDFNLPDAVNVRNENLPDNLQPTALSATYAPITGSTAYAVKSVETSKADITALTAHTGNISNPHAVTKAQVGLGSVDNTADTAKPVSTATQTALNGKVAKGELFLNAKDYGAVGDGVADDTTALQNWLTAGGVRLTNGTYRITAGLTVAGNNRLLITDAAKIVADTANIKMLTVSGNNVTLRVNLDGNNKANYGIAITGSGVLVEHCVIENIYAAADTARGVDIITTGGCIVRHNIIRNVNSVGDASTGNNIGAARAIILSAATAATVKSVISNNVIDSIIGEEGDAIQVLFTNYVSAKTTIADNKISNVSRRFIKIQAADCQVLDNTLTHDGTVPAIPANSIDLISSSNVLVEGNFIGPNPLLVAISCSGTAGAPNLNNVIKNNTIRQDDAKASISVYFNYVNESTIEGNTFHGGSYAASIGNSVGVLISGNVHFGGNTANPSFSANGTNTGVVMRNNVNMAAARVTTASNSSTSGLTEYNAKRP